jgi:hypothetical protein
MFMKRLLGGKVRGDCTFSELIGEEKTEVERRSGKAATLEYAVMMN